MIPNNIKQIYDEIISQPNVRATKLNELGQKYLINLNGLELQKAVIDMWQYFCDNQALWKGQLMIPLFYRKSKTKIIINDIWYNLKEYFLCAVVYPNELKNFFSMSEEGIPVFIGDSNIRLISKEVIKETFREDGKYQTKLIKPGLDFKLSSGFTISQKQDIFDSSIIGLVKNIQEIVVNPTKIKPVKSNKKSDKIDKTQ